GNAVPAIHLCGWLLPHGCGLRGSGKSELQTYLIRTTSRLYDCGLHGSERLDLSVKGGCVPRTVDGAADIDEIGGVGQGDPTVYHQSRTCRCLSVGGKREFHRCERRLPHVHRTAAAIGGIKIAPRVDEAVTLRINSVGESDIPSHQIGTRRDVRELDHSRRLDARRPAYLSVGERGVHVSIGGGVCSIRARNSLDTLSARQAVNPVNSRCAVNTVGAVDTRSSRCPSLCHYYPRKRARYRSPRCYGTCCDIRGGTTGSGGCNSAASADHL